MDDGRFLFPDGSVLVARAGALYSYANACAAMREHPNASADLDDWYVHAFTGLTVGQVSELIDLFGDDCIGWHKSKGVVKVRFVSEAEALSFLDNHEFSE